MWAWPRKGYVPEFAVGDDATPTPHHIAYSGSAVAEVLAGLLGAPEFHLASGAGRVSPTSAMPPADPSAIGRLTPAAPTQSSAPAANTPIVGTPPQRRPR